jgi:orotidine-5'-phosphate decarboxylase
MHRETFIAKLTDVQQTVEQLLAELQASEHDRFAAHLYRSRREYRSVCERAGKSGKQIERCVISTFQVAESMGFKGDFRQWEHLLRIGD